MHVPFTRYHIYMSCNNYLCSCRLGSTVLTADIEIEIRNVTDLYQLIDTVIVANIAHDIQHGLDNPGNELNEIINTLGDNIKIGDPINSSVHAQVVDQGETKVSLSYKLDIRKPP